MSVAASRLACLCFCACAQCLGAISSISLKPALKSYTPDHCRHGEAAIGPPSPSPVTLPLAGATVTEMPCKYSRIHMFSPDTSNIFKMELQAYPCVCPPGSAHSDHEASVLVGDPLFLGHSHGVCLCHRSLRGPLLMSHFRPLPPPAPLPGCHPPAASSALLGWTSTKASICNILSQSETLAVCSDFHVRLRAGLAPEFRMCRTQTCLQRGAVEKARNGQENGHRVEKLIPATQDGEQEDQKFKAEMDSGEKN